ncbi:acyl-CoA desaturase [Nostoc sp. MG11]|uniref:acyl-CoA desaturase n=1 Tax=Nostoc sp. MG11 TaxID=2721166 RepID=UPI001D013880|nr:acyl-CoA desaturase [Nostoc sp. MG11]
MEVLNSQIPEMSMVASADNSYAETDTQAPTKVKRQKKTVTSSYLKTLQQIHALTVGLVSCLGFVIAVALLLAGNTLSPIEIGTYLALTVVIGIGTTAGFHRHFTHKSFQAAMPVRVVLAVLGSMAAQGPLIFWVALHRLHHEHSDRPGDPHSPHFHGKGFFGMLRGLWHAHFAWTIDYDAPNATYYANDLLRDKVLSKVSQMYFLWVFLGFLIPTVAGGFLRGSWTGAFYGFLWGGLVRLFFWHNMVWCITSVAHVFGSRPLESHDMSTNNFLLAIPTLGESWHNNHHAFPNSAMAGLKWWQIDPSGWVIRALEKLGLVWDVKTPTARMMEAKTRTA